MAKQQWRTRTRGSRRQVGKRFVLSPSQQKLKSQLPKVTQTRRGVMVTSPERAVELSMVKVNTNQLIPRESHPVNLNERAEYFVDLYKRGHTIPPILVHKLPNGKYEIIDGHARVEAYRRLRITQIPAVNNDILKTLGHAAGLAGRALASGAKIVGRGIKKGAIETARTAGEMQSAYREGSKRKTCSEDN